MSRVCVVALALGALSGCETEVPPSAPAAVVVAPVESPTNQPLALLRGTKPSATALIINGDEVLPLSADGAFAVSVELEEGGNRLSVQAKDALGQLSPAVSIGITLDTLAPDEPDLDPVPARTVRTQLLLTGDKPTGSILYVNGVEHPETADDATFSIPFDLALGENRLRMSTMDSIDNESDIIARTIERFAAVPLTVTEPVDGSLAATSPVLVTGTRGAGVVLEIDGPLADVTLPAALVDDDAFSEPVPLSPGNNTIVLTAYFDGEPAQSIVVQRDVTLMAPPAPPTIDPLPARSGASVAVTGTKPAGTAVLRDGTQVVAADAATTWGESVTLPAEGDNTFGYQVRDPQGQLSTEVFVSTIRDTVAPSVLIATPAAADVVDDVLALTGTVVEDDPGVTTAWCAGSCALPADFVALPLTGNAFNAGLDLSARGDLADGVIVDVRVRATDTRGLTSTTVVAAVLSRVPAPTNAAGQSALALAAGDQAFRMVIATRNGGVINAAHRVGPPAAGAPATPISDATALDVSDPRATQLGQTGAVAFGEASPRAGGGAFGQRGLVVVPFTAGGFGSPEIVPSVAGSDVSAVDIAALPGGELAIAAVQDDVVLLMFTTGGAPGAPITLSDASTTAVGDVRIGVGDDDVATVAWIEASARDGAADDADVVVRRGDAAGPIDAAPLLVSTNGGGLIDAEDTHLGVAAQPGATWPSAVALVNGGELWLFGLGGVTLAETARAQLDASGNVTDVALASAPGEVLLAAARGTEIVLTRGAPGALAPLVVVSIQASSQPAVAAGHVALVDARGVVVQALTELP